MEDVPMYSEAQLKYAEEIAFEPFTRLKDASMMRSKTLSNPILGFAMISNWIMDYPVYQEKQFTLQVMALMKDKTPMQLLTEIGRGKFSLNKLLVFDNDFNFYSLKELFVYNYEEKVIKMNQGITAKKAERYHYHLAEYFFNASRKGSTGPWVLMTEYRDGVHGKSFFDFAVVKVLRGTDPG